MNFHRFFICISLFGCISLGAQTNEGLHFWLGFMEHRDIGQNKMVVMITSKYNTSGLVRIPLRGWEQAFQVTANSVTLVTLPAYAENTGSEAIGNVGVEVLAAAPVSVYAHQYHASRSEATVVLPEESLDQAYYVLTYKGVVQQGLDYPSEFLIVGMEDETVATITVSGPTKGGRAAGETFTVLLDAGETYQVQSATGTGDLSGSFISSDKKCNVFAGCRWTEVPTGCQARDNLLEQMSPLSTWGKQFVAVPNANMAYDIYRILATADQTVVQVEGASVQTFNLDKGEFVEYQRSEPTFIRANHPIAVMQYLIGSGCSGYPVGDPSMVMLNSVEQIRDTVTLYSSSFEAISENYINIITRTVDSGLVVFDGQPLTALGVAMQPVGAQADYAFARLRVNAGAHTLISSGCGLIATAYGYGPVESYAYGGGAAFSRLNANPVPEGGCLNDTIYFDTGLKPPRYTFNWDLGDGAVSTEPAFEHFYSALGTYPVRLLIRDNCLDLTDTITRDLQITLRQAVEVGADTNLCVGARLQLSATDLANARYEWIGPGNYFSDAQFPLLTDLNLAQSGVYSAVGIVSGCATFPAETEITVHPLPLPALGQDTFICTRNADFSWILDPGIFTAYKWSDYSTAPTLSIREEGIYWVRVGSEYGCEGADTIVLRERCPTQWYVPNAFSPNDDGFNDLFSVFGTDIQALRLRIYDRWGALIFESTAADAAWDGAFRGKPVAPGVYIWVADIEGFREDGSLFRTIESGNLTLFR
jgi:gliding motility-associated-like protein